LLRCSVRGTAATGAEPRMMGLHTHGVKPATLSDRASGPMHWRLDGGGTGRNTSQRPDQCQTSDPTGRRRLRHAARAPRILPDGPRSDKTESYICSTDGNDPGRFRSGWSRRAGRARRRRASSGAQAPQSR
jgi:hypothetical protein